jgi:hypothetical protein
MKTEEFKRVYGESRNGANKMIRYPLVRSVAISDGIRDLADTGTWWLFDIFATELPAVFRQQAAVSNRAILKARVSKGQATLTAEFDDDMVAWKKRITHTDMPEGEWLFMMADEYEGDCRYRIILISEY